MSVLRDPALLIVSVKHPHLMLAPALDLEADGEEAYYRLQPKLHVSAQVVRESSVLREVGHGSCWYQTVAQLIKRFLLPA